MSNRGDCVWRVWNIKLPDGRWNYKLICEGCGFTLVDITLDSISPINLRNLLENAWGEHVAHKSVDTAA